MATGYYGPDHYNQYGIQNIDGRYWGYRQRTKEIRIVVMHTPEVLEDFTGPDNSAEAVARYFATTSRAASCHYIADSDSEVLWASPSHVTFHVRNYNSISYGCEVGWRATSWGKRPDLDEKIIQRVARHLAPRMMRWGVPATYVTRGQVDLGYGGMTSHAQLDPTRRTDPGTLFPWSDLLTYIRLEQMVLTLTQEEIRFLKAMIDKLKKMDPPSNEDFAAALVQWKRDGGG